MPPTLQLRLAQEADSLGYYSLWTAEAWGTDCDTALIWLAAQTDRIRLDTAIMRMAARTTATTAIAAATLDLLTRGRMIMDLRISGSRMVEGWHGVPYGKPPGRAREDVMIVRIILARVQSLEHLREHYDLLCKGGTDMGIAAALDIPSRAGHYSNLPRRHRSQDCGARGRDRRRLAARDVLPEWMNLLRPSLDEGFAPAVMSKDWRPFDIAAMVEVQFRDDAAACQDAARPTLALNIGGMDAKHRNCYFDLGCRYDYGDAAHAAQDVFLDGRMIQAEAVVLYVLVDEVALCGPRVQIAECLEAWHRSSATTLICVTTNLRTVRTMGGLAG